MSDYEFWKELGKIFNSVIAYQEKTIEFNKRFINPWIRLGNVFEQQDRHREAVRAHQHAIEIDPDNAQNWLELGNAHFRNQAYTDAERAFQKAIELDPNLGWPYSNLALIYVEQNKHAEAKALYEKSIQLLKEDREKAISWNRLGNLHRRLNEYDLAIQAFQKADELDQENAGFRDELDEELTQTSDHPGCETALNDLIATPIRLIVEQSQSEEETLATDDIFEETVAAEVDLPANRSQEFGQVSEEESDGSEITMENSLPVSESAADPSIMPNEVDAAPLMESESNLTIDGERSVENASPEQPEEKVQPVEPSIMPNEVDAAPLVESESNLDIDGERSVEIGSLEQPEENVPQSEDTFKLVTEEPAVSEAVEAVSDEMETYTTTEIAPHAETETYTFDAAPVMVEETVSPASAPEELPLETGEGSRENETNDQLEVEIAEEPPAETGQVVIASEVDAEPLSLSREICEEVQENPVQDESAAMESAARVVDDAGKEHPASEQASYEAFLKDDEQAQNPFVTEASQEALPEQDVATSREAVTIIDESGEFQLEMDTKNAHVWNELGNVYFNRGEFDDAIIAYSKAIDLDRLFAWPYSNLALAYVQKGHLAEAMLLYQRSIELFKSEKDKAISWNRLGNVYRRLNDYDNAVAAYQRADELDPDNTTIYMQSRFSLLGNFQMEQSANFNS